MYLTTVKKKKYMYILFGFNLLWTRTNYVQSQGWNQSRRVSDLLKERQKTFSRVWCRFGKSNCLTQSLTFIGFSLFSKGGTTFISSGGRKISRAELGYSNAIEQCICYHLQINKIKQHLTKNAYRCKFCHRQWIPCCKCS